CVGGRCWPPVRLRLWMAEAADAEGRSFDRTPGTTKARQRWWRAGREWWRRAEVESAVQGRITADLLQACSVLWISRFGPPADRVPLRQPGDLLRALPGVGPTAS